MAYKDPARQREYQRLWAARLVALHPERKRKREPTEEYRAQAREHDARYRARHRGRIQESQKRYEEMHRVQCSFCGDQCHRNSKCCEICIGFMYWVFGIPRDEKMPETLIETISEVISLEDKKQWEAINSKKKESALRKRLLKTLQSQITGSQPERSPLLPVAG